MSTFISNLPAWSIDTLYLGGAIMFSIGVNRFKKSLILGMTLIILSAISIYIALQAEIPDDNPAKWATIIAPIIFILSGIAFGNKHSLIRDTNNTKDINEDKN